MTYKRVEIPAKTRALVWLRDDGHCQICGAKLTDKTVDYEHRIQAWLLADEPERYNAPDNIYLICGLRSGEPCHKDKTAKDATDRAKVKRIRAREHGEVRPSRGRKLQSRGFDTTRPAQKIPSRPFLPRRPKK